MAEKVYVGKGKVVGNYGQIKLGIRVSELTVNENGYCNLIVQKMKEPDKFGNGFTVYIDDFIPNNQRQVKPQPSVHTSVHDDNLPF